MYLIKQSIFRRRYLVTDRVECKLKAKELLRGRWENAVGACLLFLFQHFY